MQCLGGAPPELVERYVSMYAKSANAPKEYRRWLAEKIKPIIRRHGLEFGRLNPGSLPRSAAERSLISEELPAALAQATLFWQSVPRGVPRTVYPDCGLLGTGQRLSLWDSSPLWNEVERLHPEIFVSFVSFASTSTLGMPDDSY